MPLRLIEVMVPGEARGEVATLIKDIPVVHVRTAESAGDIGVVRILLEAKNTEAISDLLVSRFGSDDAFRMILFSVEATLPAAVEPTDPQSVKPGGTEGSKRESQRISREELYEDIAQASQLTATYIVMVALSTVVAAVGLVRGDVAIIIGAMVIAPLLGPNMALSLAATLGDPELTKKSLRAIAAGVATAAALSLMFGIAFGVDPEAPAVAARMRPDIGDVVLALAAGAAGTLAFTSGVPAVVVGVMVAVALLPPLVVVGLLVGAGYWHLASGAFILLLTNVTCVNLAAIATFFIQKVSPRTWWEAARAKRRLRVTVTVWLLMLILLVALIFLGHVGGGRL